MDITLTIPGDLAVPTRRDQLAAFDGSSQEALDILARVTAPARVAARVAAASSVGQAWGAALRDLLLPEFGAATVLAAAAVGTHGGGWQDPGAGTTRIPGFAALGSGRRNASDGAAWDAAIRSAWIAAWQVLRDARPEVPYVQGPEEALLVLADEWGCADLIAALGDGAAARAALRWWGTRTHLPLTEGATRLAEALAAEARGEGLEIGVTVSDPAPAPDPPICQTAGIWRVDE